MNETTTFLTGQRSRLMSRLVDLAASYMDAIVAAEFKVKAQAILDEITTVEVALRSIQNNPSSMRYAKFSRHIDAIVQFLKDVGAPMAEQSIIDAVIDGGFLSGNEKNPLYLSKSIGIFLRGTGKSTNTLKQIGDLIGLYDWPDELFKA
ncbi:hypothetical protein ACOBR2_13280 [Telmatobacter bradus]|uniref:hypothetical protein n=1 Tax=Telmatobacter bradus TaxID=474953 RepID=UPI003B43A3D5